MLRRRYGAVLIPSLLFPRCQRSRRNTCSGPPERGTGGRGFPLTTKGVLMARIEDYALIGDCETGALVGRDGSIDWLCFPRFDSDSCFGRLLGDEKNGYWSLRPVDGYTNERRYLPGTLILETVFATETGRARLVDFMPPKTGVSKVVRIV
ncbi:GH15 family glucan-1,4-alpha-glucosidase [Bradyrhizobium sp. LB7.1]